MRLESRLSPLLALAIFFFSNAPVWAEPNQLEAESKPVVTFGGFIDTYYAFDFNQPVPNERVLGTPEGINGTSAQLATTATRHNEFNINLAYLDAKLAAKKLRGRLAIQAGTSVEATYASEPTNGIASGPSLMRFVQEATLGYEVANGLWIDAGIFLSHLGLETFISKDNWTYTRSLVADFSPYYEAGVKASWQVNPQWVLQFLVLNGWQNISDYNSSKAVGTAIAFSPSSQFSISYNTFLGQEVGSLWRVFNDFIVKYELSHLWQLALEFDIGWQQQPAVGPASNWYGTALFARVALSPKLSVTGRLERYVDGDRVIVQPVGGLSMRANGASINVDYELQKGLLWRNEVRGLFADSAIFPKGSGYASSDTFVVSSLSLAF